MGVGSSSPQRWDGSTMPSQAGKTVIVTGSNSGIGFFTARALAERGAHVVLACRSESRGRTAVEEITQYLSACKTEGVGKVEFMQVDLSNLVSVRRFAADFRRRFDRADLLINNAGVAAPPQLYSADGFEVHFGVNHLGHYLLTALLMSSLKRSGAPRVVTVSSLNHRNAYINFDHIVKGIPRSSFSSLWPTPVIKLYTGLVHYGWSKLMNLLFTYELSRRLRSANVSNVISVASYPGVSYTPIFEKGVQASTPRFLWPILSWLIWLLPGQSAEMGALPTLYAATAESVKTGEYFGPDGLWGMRGYPVKEQSRPQSHSKEDAARLWTLSEELTKERFQIE